MEFVSVLIIVNANQAGVRKIAPTQSATITATEKENASNQTTAAAPVAGREKIVLKGTATKTAVNMANAFI
jgi:hypothetical protein